MVKESRPTFEEIYMRLAITLAERSTCARLKVGTVITSTDFRKVLAVGYNGNASGLHNGCDRDEVGNCGCLHSEENAVINCDSPRSTEKVVFVTHLPCAMCAKRLINLGNVRRVLYAHDYRRRDSVDLFAQVGVAVDQIMMSGIQQERK
jgi:dCMP deaminase